ncbi:hypothetical protein RV14_GL000862 [Enterococcus ratti]|uniref:Uncharacterized protein n=1 Tax=Enterococcus ratti TaxID=150033 RepID=A0A1L8WEK2_9ENTE|nr:hypothetical protein RV14_GL000862 [Enterococcus ratti]
MARTIVKYLKELAKLINYFFVSLQINLIPIIFRTSLLR